MSNLPKQLQRQAAEVTRIETEMAAAANEPATPTDIVAPPPETPPAAPATPPTPPPVPDAGTDWEQRYRSLEGKYRAEVPRLHGELRELKASFSALETKLTATPAPAPAPETPKAKPRLVTAKDAETFGPDLLDVIKRQAQDIADELVAARESKVQTDIKKLADENEALKQRLGDVTKTQEATSQDVYLTRLAKLVPDWETVNSDPEFLLWLDDVDPFTGLKRQAYLDSAFTALDHQRTAVLFDAWKRTKAPASTPAPVPPEPSEIQRQVTPGKSKSTPTPAADPSQRLWSTGEIEKFYDDVRHGRIKGDEVKRTEKEIDLAVSTGRIR